MPARGRSVAARRDAAQNHPRSRWQSRSKLRGNLRTVFALADSAITVLPPNQEALFGLNSVNSYDSLSSRRYQELMEHWSAAGTRMYGRQFKFLDIEWAFADRAFPFSSAHLILSARPLAADQLTLATEVNEIKLYETITTPIELLQTLRFKFSNGGEAAIGSIGRPGESAITPSGNP